MTAPSYTYHGFSFPTLEAAEAHRTHAEEAGYVATHSPAGKRHVIWGPNGEAY